MFLCSIICKSFHMIKNQILSFGSENPKSYRFKKKLVQTLLLHTLIKFLFFIETFKTIFNEKEYKLVI